jgi:prevent-host-death family protein
MSMAEHVSLAEVKNRLSEVVERIERAHGRVIITKHGQPSAVIMNLEDLESLEETLSILSNPRLLTEIRRAEAEIAAGKSKRLSKDEAVRLAKRR